MNYREAKRDFDRDFITEALRDNRGKITVAARAVGVTVKTLRQKIRDCGIDVKNLRGSFRGIKIRGVPMKDNAAAAVRCVYARFAKYAEHADYAEFAEFAMFANQERKPPEFETFAKQQLLKQDLETTCEHS